MKPFTVYYCNQSVDLERLFELYIGIKLNGPFEPMALCVWPRNLGPLNIVTRTKGCLVIVMRII